MLTDKVRELERENEDAREHLKSRSSADQKARELEGQVRQHRDHADDLSNTLASLRVEHDTLQKSTRAQASSSNDINRLTNELHEAKELANELRGEVTSLAEELRNVSARYEASLGDLDIERKQRADLEDEIRSWRKRYEGAKTELRSVKGMHAYAVTCRNCADGWNCSYEPDVFVGYSDRQGPHACLAGRAHRRRQPDCVPIVNRRPFASGEASRIPSGPLESFVLTGRS